MEERKSILKVEKEEKAEKRKGGKENKFEKKNEEFLCCVYKIFEPNQYSKPVKCNSFC